MGSHQHRPQRKRAHKPFKGHSKRRIASKVAGRVASMPSSVGVIPVANRPRRGREVPLTTPLVIAILPLHEDVDLEQAQRLILAAADPSASWLDESTQVPHIVHCAKANITVCVCSAKDKPRDGSWLFCALDAAKAADVVVPVLRQQGGMPHDENSRFGVDAQGDSLVAALKTQGLPAVLGMLQPPPAAADGRVVARTASRYFETLFAGLDRAKLLSVGNVKEAHGFLRRISNIRRRGVAWRDIRSHMIVDHTEFCDDVFVCGGFLRGHALLSANQLIHVTGHGDFALRRIQVVKDGSIVQSIEAQSDKVESLKGLADIDPLAHEQSVILADEIRDAVMNSGCAEDVQERLAERKSILVESGMNEYQATWEAVLSDDDGGDSIDGDDTGRAVRFSEEASMEVDSGDGEHSKLSARMHRLERDDMEFPDEVETPLDRAARLRFAKYRGLSNWLTAPWDVLEGLPLEYSKIAALENYTASNRRLLKEIDRRSVSSNAMQTDDDADETVGAGAYVLLHLVVPCEERRKALLEHVTFTNALVVSGLFRHERLVSVVHHQVRRCDNEEGAPLRSKDPVIVCSGFRRTEARPLFSTLSPSQLNSSAADAKNRHKLERFLPRDRPCMATSYDRVQFGAPFVKTLIFRRSISGEPELVASGSLLDVDPNRLIIKRIRLTGYPIRVHKRRAVVRWMFFNSDDVRWFKPVQLSTKYGLVGHIDSSVGMHGHFKATFNGPIKQHDTVCLHLYKRQFPPAVWPDDHL